MPIEGRREATETDQSNLRQAGYLFGLGAISMLIGAIIKRVVGADLDGALAGADIGQYLAAASGLEAGLFINLSFWILGAFLIGSGGYLISRHRPDTVSGVAAASYLIGSVLAISSFVTWIAVVRLAETTQAFDLADALGFIASRSDWIATVLIVGLGPLLVSIAGRDTWVPRWLFVLGAVTAFAGAHPGCDVCRRPEHIWLCDRVRWHPLDSWSCSDRHPPNPEPVALPCDASFEDLDRRFDNLASLVISYDSDVTNYDNQVFEPPAPIGQRYEEPNHQRPSGRHSDGRSRGFFCTGSRQ